MFFIVIPAYAAFTLMKDFAGEFKEAKLEDDNDETDGKEEPVIIRRYNLRHR